jgi:hypothetical protein
MKQPFDIEWTPHHEGIPSLCVSQIAEQAYTVILYECGWFSAIAVMTPWKG